MLSLSVLGYVNHFAMEYTVPSIWQYIYYSLSSSKNGESRYQQKNMSSQNENKHQHNNEMREDKEQKKPCWIWVHEHAYRMIRASSRNMQLLVSHIFGTLNSEISCFSTTGTMKAKNSSASAGRTALTKPWGQGCDTKSKLGSVTSTQLVIKSSNTSKIGSWGQHQSWM